MILFRKSAIYKLRAEERKEKRVGNIPSDGPKPKSGKGEESEGVVDPNKRSIPWAQQHVIPRVKYDNDRLVSVLTLDQHRLYLARLANLKNHGKFESQSNKNEVKVQCRPQMAKQQLTLAQTPGGFAARAKLGLQLHSCGDAAGVWNGPGVWGPSPH